MRKYFKHKLLLLFVGASLLLLSFVLIPGGKKAARIMAEKKGFAVVELFTSEGCSSCPSADAAIARLLAKNMKNVYIVCYHVDYWNRLGWKDEFSDYQYSERQQQYARRLSLEGVYTPQIVVNGSTEFVGSNENALSNAITNNTNNQTTSNLHITAETKNNVVLVKYVVDGAEAQLLNTTVVLPEADTKVRRGENEGKTLHHVNIVNNLKVVEVKGKGELSIEIPPQLKGKQIKVIAYTQSKQSLKVLGADEVHL